MGATPRAWVWLALAIVTCAASGCWESSEEKDAAKPAEPRPPAASVTLTIGLGDDPQLRAAIELLTGEWREVSGGGFEVVDLASQGPEAVDADTDLIIFSPLRLGELCELGALRPMRESTLASEQLNLDDFYPAVRDHLLKYGGRTMALPIGCVTPVVATTSEEAVEWSGVSNSSLSTVEQSVGTPRPAWRLLARVAPLAANKLRESVLFDPETMAPSITSPPFVEALTELSSAVLPETGEPASALVLPMRSGMLRSEARVWTHAQAPPGTGRYFDPIRVGWAAVNGPPRRVSLVGVDGRLIGVTSGSRNAAAAFKLAAWLTGISNSRQLATASPHVANVRRSLSGLPDNWLGEGGPGMGREFASAVKQAWQSEDQLVVPRLIDAERYLAILDEAVATAMATHTPEQALELASERWEALTDEIGRDRQRRCYLRHLGVDQYTPEKR